MATKQTDETPEELSVNEGVDELPEAETPEVDERNDEVEEAEEEDSPVTAAGSDEDESTEDEAVAAETPRKEHTLEDLAEEDQPLPTGVDPQRPKSFKMDMDEEEESTFAPRRSFNSNFPSSGVYASSRGGSGGGKKGNLLILAVVALLVIGGSVYLLKSRIGRNASPEPSASPSELVTSSASPTPSPAIDRSKYKIRVLNGTSTAGLAASVSGKLKDLGYQIDKTGNASNSAFTTTVINSKSGLQQLIDTLTKDLAPSFSASAGGSLKDSDNADAEIILGTH